MHPVEEFGVLEQAPSSIPGTEARDILEDCQETAMFHRYREFTRYMHTQVSFQRRLRRDLNGPIVVAYRKQQRSYVVAMDLRYFYGRRYWKMTIRTPSKVNCSRSIWLRRMLTVPDS